MKIKSAKELINERNAREEINKKRYEKVLIACINRIENTNLLTKDTSIMFELPDNLGISCPNYDKKACCKYIKDTLTSHGYVVDTFNNNNYFSIAAMNISIPGGVSGAVFWVKADAGVTGVANVSAWVDQSGSGNHATQGTMANQPALVANDLNFNPSISSIMNSAPE